MSGPGKVSVTLFGTTYEFDVPDTDPERIRCVTASEYARRTGQSADSVRGKLRRGTLKGEKVGGEWLIPEPPEEDDPRARGHIQACSPDDVEAFIASLPRWPGPDARRQRPQATESAKFAGAERKRANTRAGRERGDFPPHSLP